MPEPEVYISPGFLGALTPKDLLQSEGTIHFALSNLQMNSNEVFFIVHGFGFKFTLYIKDKIISFLRNDFLSQVILDEFSDSSEIHFMAMWSINELRFFLRCKQDKDIMKSIKVETDPASPPQKLIKWARQQTLIPQNSFESEEMFRSAIHEALNEINNKIHRTNSYKSFWNIEYEGQKIIKRTPKTETEVQPLIHALLSDHLFLKGIEVFPETHTGAGNIDFLFSASLVTGGISKIAGEFKLAHSKDLIHGMTDQLPEYMRAHQCTYGIYCILNYKGDWFQKPKTPENRDLYFHLSMETKNYSVPELEFIRPFVFDLAKPKTASKK